MEAGLLKTTDNLVLTHILSFVFHDNNTIHMRRVLRGVCWRLRTFLPSDDDDNPFNCALSAARHGHLSILSWLIPNPSWSQCRLFGTAAARRGHVNILEWIEDEVPRMAIVLSEAAAIGGQTDTLAWLKTRLPSFTWNSIVLSGAAREGHLETLKWLTANGGTCDSVACMYAAEHGHLSTLQWLLEQVDSCCVDDLVDYAAGEGHLHVVRWLVEECDVDFSEWGPAAAASNGHIHVLSYMKMMDFPFTYWVTVSAASNGNLVSLDWLYQKGLLRFSAIVMRRTIDRGHLESLCWLKAHGCPWDRQSVDDYMVHAAQAGRLSILKYLWEETYTWTKRVGKAAASQRNLDLLAWMQEKGYPWQEDMDACVEACRSSRLFTLQWLVANGAPFPVDRCILFSDMPKNLKDWLYEQKELSSSTVKE